MLKWEDKVGGLGWIGKEREWGDEKVERGEEDLFYSERKSNG